MSQILEKIWECTSCLKIPRNTDPVNREVLYNILLEFGIPKNPLRLNKMRLNTTYRMD
jgi:hypothetical protein